MSGTDSSYRFRHELSQELYNRAGSPLVQARRATELRRRGPKKKKKMMADSALSLTFAFRVLC